ncbi:MAG: polysaccharide deacetylase family protein [Pseudomonadales bacterium]|jgi:peptidoglycan/xylan/chitin deacetylase (PgdA/CDA1 family)|nr:polysaccharide deacetylase family protein [Pseudomonadales bacterium]
MKKLVETIATGLDAIGLFALMENFDKREQQFRVLTYHRVGYADESPNLEPGLISASPEEFRKQMQLLAKRYNPISMAQLLAAHRGESTLPARAVLVTFDDGYRDFAEVAWPILKDVGVPATLFVPTAFPDGENRGFWWDRIHAALLQTKLTSLQSAPLPELSLENSHLRRQAYKMMRNHVKSLPHGEAMAWVEQTLDILGHPPPLNQVLDWDALRMLAAEGLCICSHGRDHALMSQLNTEQLREDLTESQTKLQAELGSYADIAVLAYPANATNSAVRSASRQAGYELAFGGQRGVNRLPITDSQEILRLPVVGYKFGLFRALLLPAVIALGNQYFSFRSKVST